MTTNMAGIIGHDIDRVMERWQAPETQARMRLIGDMGTEIVKRFQADMARFAESFNESTRATRSC